MSRIPTTNPLKPERIGATASLVASSPLKPERIGFRLQKLPGWELLTESQAIWRSFRFHRSDTAEAFATYVARSAREHGQRAQIAQSWNEVTVMLPGEGRVTEAVFDFAERLSLLPEGVEPTPQPSPVAAPAGPTPVPMPQTAGAASP